MTPSPNRRRRKEGRISDGEQRNNYAADLRKPAPPPRAHFLTRCLSARPAAADHTGTTNQFHVNSGSHLARLLHNNRSPLAENHHAFVAASLLDAIPLVRSAGRHHHQGGAGHHAGRLELSVLKMPGCHRRRDPAHGRAALAPPARAPH